MSYLDVLQIFKRTCKKHRTVRNKLLLSMAFLGCAFYMNCRGNDIYHQAVPSDTWAGSKSDISKGHTLMNQDTIPFLSILEVKPTIFFPKADEGESLKQKVELVVHARESARDIIVKVLLPDGTGFVEKIGDLSAGPNTKAIHVPDIDRPAEISFELYQEDKSEAIDTKTISWQPQKKWKVYYTSFSHQDMGYADYYHMIRRDVRELGIERALEYCRKTDDWDEKDRYRWVVETSEPVIGFVQSHSHEEVDELIRRIKEGRIELGAVHNTVNSEGLSYEVLARLFYTPNRHIVDLLDIPPSKTAMINDVVGITRSFPMYLKEADIPYFFHGRNGLENQMLPASSRPYYYWKAPDGDRENMSLCTTRGYHALDAYGFKRHEPVPTIEVDMDEELIQNQIAKLENESSDCILYHYSWDFNPPFLQTAQKARNWNQKWSYPRMISSTMSQYFEDVESQVKPEDIYVFDKDAPNTWIDQDYTDAALAGNARKLGYVLPTLEKFATIANVTVGTNYPWKELWESYNLLLMYHEHTNSGGETVEAFIPPSLSDKSKGGLCYYETEKIMHRQLIEEGERFAKEAEMEVFKTLGNNISTGEDKTIVVFNQLNWGRSEMVRVKLPQGVECPYVIDNTSGKQIPCQKLAKSEILFRADDIPSLGYKTFSICPEKIKSEPFFQGVTAGDTTLENRFYNISFDKKTGGIGSIYDKQLKVELVDQDSKYKLNEYVYHFSPDGAEGDWYSPESAVLSSQSGPVSGSMTAAVKAKGVHGIKQTVRIYADIKRIDFHVEMDKASSGRQFSEYSDHELQKKKEAVFYAFPLNIPDFKIRHELAGAVVEPVADQSTGSNTDYYSIQHFSDISGAEYGLTLATTEAGLVEYGRPVPSTTFRGRSNLVQPENSHLFLYLMNNWFFTNIVFDQPGPKSFTWSIRSHPGDWRSGEAHKFGWDVSHPVTAMVIDAKQKGTLPPDQFSFVEVESDKADVVLTTMKRAESNGSGYILRFNELSGTGGTVQATLNFTDKISGATETSLVELDRPYPLMISDENRITFDIRPHGVKTIRVMMPASGPSVRALKARGVSDMGVDLSWKPAGSKNEISCYRIYRHTSPDFKPGLRYFIGQTAAESFSDRPELNYGGWKNNCLQPETSYFYKVCAVDRANNGGEPSETVTGTTLSSDQQNEVPLKVAGLKVAHVSPNDSHNVVSIWFYTNVEPDINHYRIYRSLTPAFEARDNNLVVEIDAIDTIVHTLPHKFDTVTRQSGDYDRQLYVDEDVEYGQRYYYKACAVDNSGQSGPLSDEISIRLMDAGMSR